MIHHQFLPSPYSPPLTCDAHSDTSTQTEELDQQSDLHPHLMSRQLARNTLSKVKSSLCRNFMEKGFCLYGRKCQFAHGPQDLRINMEVNRSYKTKQCHTFTKKGYCLYGARCNFIHEQQNGLPQRQKWATIYSNHRETVNPCYKQESSRLIQLLHK